MALAAGTKLGRYEILGLIGTGGMGEVYRARDCQLQRHVAIKLSKEPFNERFEREALAVAALNHPHICTLYDVGSNYLVMEYIEGHPLSGPLPLERVLKYADEICQALDAAHTKKIAHRDLKPANILVTKTGLKLLDFGIARVTDSADASTITASGAVMGTPAYMAPEQWADKPADARTDIYAFGCVLYELLTGKRAAENRTPVKPEALERVLQLCLAQDPEERWQSVRDLRHALNFVQPASAAEHQASGRMRYLPWAVAVALGLIAIAALWAPWRNFAPGAPQRLRRVDLALGAEPARANLGPDAILSPDGTRIVQVARGTNGQARLLTRMIDQARTLELSGTEGASAPFFSPDGAWVAFFAGGKLKKTRLDGGEPVTLCDAAAGRGGSWGEDGYIVVARDSFAGLSRLPATGGEPTSLTELEPDELTHRWPQILPGGKAVLFSLNKTYANFGASSIAILTLADRKRKVVLANAGMYARYVPSGHLTYVTKGNLVAIPFDLDSLTVRGQPVQVLEEVSNDATFGFAQLNYSADGMLLYHKGRTQGLRTIHWLEPGKALQPLIIEPATYQCLRISPDQNNLVWMMNQGPNADIWNFDLARRTKTLLTDSKGVCTSPIWSPGGKYIIFNANKGIYWTPADDARPQPLTPLGPHQYPSSFTADGRRLVFYQRTRTGGAIWTVQLDGTSEEPKPKPPELFLQTKTALTFPAISPDGHWLAYGDIESGTYEVYVRAFPDKGKKWPISNSGGVMPFWSPKDNKLFYRTEDSQIMVTTYSVAGDEFKADTPQLWSDEWLANTGLTPNLDLAPDGKRFAVLMPAEAPEPLETRSHVTLVMNFLEDLRRRVPVTK